MTLEKELGSLTQSMGLLWSLLILQTIFLWLRRRWLLSLIPIGIAVLMSFIGCTQFTFNLVASLEAPYARGSLDDLPECDAVVMLGGAHDPSRYDPFGIGFQSATERPVMALELMRRKRAPNLVLGGGAFLENGRALPDAVLLERWIAAWQLPAGSVTNLGINQNTHDEAIHFRELADEKKWKRVLLVTSGWHMKRAEAVFRGAGVDVIPVGCDFESVGSVPHLKANGIVPKLGGFRALDIYLHETVGWYVYRARGWIETPPPPSRENGPAPTAKPLEVRAPADSSKPAPTPVVPVPPPAAPSP
jgi:uncharacterized SAM-binding protein YcdF (DUF218 family)